ncbi:MAG: hypothetical protein Aurels2KO_54550 [Aureliella sp.]
MAKKKKVRKRRDLKPAPVYEIVGWLTEAQAADMKTTKENPTVRTTISRWRSGGFIHHININEALIVVPTKEVSQFDGVPMGGELPPMVDELPDEIELVLRRKV